MANVFISHSRRDPDIRDAFLKLFGLSPVNAVCKEYDIYRSPPWIEIRTDIQKSKALFLLMGPNLMPKESPYTANWVTYELSVARELDKDIWIFEELSRLVDFPIPSLDASRCHYMLYERNNPEHESYIREIIAGYIDPDWASAAGWAGLGAIGGKVLTKKDEGALWGALFAGGLKLITSSPKPPSGLPVWCPYDSCHVEFQLHTRVAILPCPSCRQPIAIGWEDVHEQA